MLIVISWHVAGFHSHWTDGWTMPVFFVIMGLFYKQPDTLASLLKKKFNSIIVPYMFFAVPAIIISLLSSGILETLKLMINPYQSINGMSWFLLCMFWCYLMYFLIYKFSGESKTCRILLSLCVSLAGFYMNYIRIFNHRLVLPFYASTAMTCMCFVSFGEMARPCILRPRRLLTQISVTAVLAIFYLGGVKIFDAQPLQMIWNTYCQPWLVLVLNALSGSCFFMSVAKILPAVIAPFGKYSMLILLSHGYFIELLNIFRMSVYVEYLAVAILSLLFSCIIYRYFPLLAGRKQIIK